MDGLSKRLDNFNSKPSLLNNTPDLVDLISKSDGWLVKSSRISVAKAGLAGHEVRTGLQVASAALTATSNDEYIKAAKNFIVGLEALKNWERAGSSCFIF